MIFKEEETDIKISHIYTDDKFEKTMDLLDWRMPYQLRTWHFNSLDSMLLNPVIERMAVQNVPIRELFSREPGQPMKLQDKLKECSYPIIRKSGSYALAQVEDGYSRVYQADGLTRSIITELRAASISLKDASEYIKRRHRHSSPPRFHKFSVSLTVEGEEEPVGVAVASTPKAPVQMDGQTLEINHCCGDPAYANVCSKLYSMVIRCERSMGYSRFLTYTLPEESGISPKAAGFRFDGMTQASPNGWDRPSRQRSVLGYPPGQKLRWVWEPERKEMQVSHDHSKAD